MLISLWTSEPHLKPVLTYHSKHMSLNLVRRNFRVFFEQLTGVRGDPREGLVVPCHAPVPRTDLRRSRVELPSIGQAGLLVLTHLVGMIVESPSILTWFLALCLPLRYGWWGRNNTFVDQAWYQQGRKARAMQKSRRGRTPPEGCASYV